MVYRVPGLGFGVWGLGFRDAGFEFWFVASVYMVPCHFHDCMYGGVLFFFLRAAGGGGGGAGAGAGGRGGQ